MKKKIVLFLACLWFIISFLIIQSTYAKYVTSVNGSTNVEISSWKMLINNQDIMNNSNFSQTLSLTVEENAYHIANYIVPGGEGYFDLALDSSEVSLNFSYTITITNVSTSNISDIKLKGYSLDGGTNITNLTGSTTQITNSVTNNVNSSSIRVYVEWNDDSTTENMNDVQDTTVANTNGKAVIQANISFEQIAN